MKKREPCERCGKQPAEYCTVVGYRMVQCCNMETIARTARDARIMWDGAQRALKEARK